MLKSWHTLDPDAYRDGRFELLAKLEGVKSAAYVDTAQGSPIPTIGIGFNMRVNMGPISTVLLGSHWTQDLQDQLQDVVDATYQRGRAGTRALDVALDQALADARAATGDRKLPRHFSLTADDMQEVLNLIEGGYEAKISRWLAGIPESVERTVLFSLSYNQTDGSALLGSLLKAAVRRGDRAEAWYEIRYHSNKHNDDPTSYRRYVEAHRFSLYDDPAHVTVKEALAVGVSYTNHRDTILAYEDAHDPETAAQVKGEPGILEISGEHAAAIAAMVKANKVVGLKFEEFQVVSAKHETLEGDGTAYDSTDNDDDLLVGDDATNRLAGGNGNDALLGKGGNDTLVGDDGHDWLDGGAGDDVMTGGTGSDTYVIDSSADRIVDSAAENAVIVTSDVTLSDLPGIITLTTRADKGLTITLAGSHIAPASSLALVALNGDGDRLVLDGDTALSVSSGGDGSVVYLDRKYVTQFVLLATFQQDDLFDITSFGVEKVVTDHEVTKVGSIYLLGPGAELDFAGDDPYVNELPGWELVTAQDRYAEDIGVFIGDLTAANFATGAAPGHSHLDVDLAWAATVHHGGMTYDLGHVALV